MEFNVAGIDVGFRKTGIAVFRMSKAGDQLIAATTICPDEPGKSVMAADVTSCLAMIDGILEFADKHDVQALFLEFPSGGSQSGRACRCMGMATGMTAAILKMADWPLGYVLFTPTEIEKLLGIHANPGDKKGKTKGLKRKEKKEALKNIVLQHYPESRFDDWPGKAAEAEDAYDAAAAFLAARKTNLKEGLYHRLRSLCEGSNQ